MRKSTGTGSAKLRYMTVRTHAILRVANPSPAEVSRGLAIRLLEAGQYRDLYLLLLEQRRHHPNDLELMRSVRVLEWYFDRKKARHNPAA